MAKINIRNRTANSSERQVARILARGLVGIGMLDARLEGEAMAEGNAPAIALEAVNPDGSVSAYLVEVRLVDTIPAQGQVA